MIVPKYLKLSVFIVLLFVLFSSVVSAGEINKSFLKGIAIEGYDPVGYFLKNRAFKGSSLYQYKWKSATWYFSSEENKKQFITNPEKYSPQYGGHCANGLSEGHKVSGDPEIWRMIDDKLYFFYSHTGRNRWSTNTDQWIIDANYNWKALKLR